MMIAANPMDTNVLENSPGRSSSRTRTMPVISTSIPATL